MRYKKLVNYFLKILGAAALFWGLSTFCEKQTKGFRPYLLLSNLPNDPRWETPSLSLEEKKEIDVLLDQPFYMLGSGGWCYAFLGEDGKTVLKFYKHTHLTPSNILKDFSFDKLLFKSPLLPSGTPYFQEFNFKSCMLLWKSAKDRSGLIYIHLNKTEGMHKNVTLIDNIGIEHKIDLDKTEFVVQKRGELIIPYLDQLIRAQQEEKAKKCLDDLLDCLLTLYKQGARDYDSSFRQNFGFADGHAIAIDLSSFGFDESLQNPTQYKKEILIKTKRLNHWLKKYHPELFAYFRNQIKAIDKEGDIPQLDKELDFETS